MREEDLRGVTVGRADRGESQCVRRALSSVRREQEGFQIPMAPSHRCMLCIYSGLPSFSFFFLLFLTFLIIEYLSWFKHCKFAARSLQGLLKIRSIVFDTMG